MKKTLYEKFREPESDFRSFPFWAWNEKMSPEMVEEQIQGMKNAGMGGFFIHSRVGLETEYMSVEWLDCVKTAVEAAAKNGMKAWLYDEDRWPSGTAGGQVTALGEEYCCKGLTVEVVEAADTGELLQERNLKALYAARVKGMVLEGFRRLSLNIPEELLQGEKLLAVRLEVSGKSEWFNYQAPPDNLNPKTLEKFLELTHEKYREVVGEYFGTIVPGIFSDEPSLADRHAAYAPNRGWIPWSGGMEEFFRERRGYDFLEVLPWQYFNGSGSAKTRHDYWHTIAERYSEVFSGSISAWCRKNRIAYTGHFLQEDKLGLCTRVNGAVMPHYAYADVPGIDILKEQTREYLTVKQCTSVARQLGKKRAMTETYGCCGWDFSLEGQKWIGDWQYVLGINMRTTHMALASLRGCRKRDYPPSFNYNSTGFDKNAVVEDYFARLGAVLCEGEPVRKLLLLHPAATAWSMVGTNPYGNPLRSQERDVPEADAVGYAFNDLIEKLCREHMDCDLGDEILMGKYGFVKDGRLGIGVAAYEAVLISGAVTLLRSTCELLLEYLRQGGKLLVVEPEPFMVEGDSRGADCLKQILEHEGCRKTTKERLIPELERWGIRESRFLGGDGKEQKKLLVQTRRTGEGMIYFVVNNDRENACEAIVEFACRGEVQEWNPLSGERRIIMSEAAEGPFRCRWEKAGSRLFFVKPCREQLAVKERQLAEECSISTDVMNVLTLDRCHYKLKEDSESEQLEVWQAQKQIRQKLGMRDIFRNEGEQRYRWVSEPHEEDGSPLGLVFEFFSEVCLEGCFLAMEQPEQFEISLNGVKADQSSQGWFLDKAFETVLLPEIRQGSNLLELHCGYRNRMELENCYLLGHFGVTRDRILVEEPKKLKMGDWTEQGYFHYCGSICYHLPYEWDGECRVFFRPGAYEAYCLTVAVGNLQTELPWAMQEEVELTAGLRKGSNFIEVTVTGSPRNMLGPFHGRKVYPDNTNDAAFTPEEADYVEEYHVVPYGLLEAPAVREEQWKRKEN